MPLQDFFESAPLPYQPPHWFPCHHNIMRTRPEELGENHDFICRQVESDLRKLLEEEKKEEKPRKEKNRRKGRLTQNTNPNPYSKEEEEEVAQIEENERRGGHPIWTLDNDVQYNISALLSYGERNYLVKYNKAEQKYNEVKITDQLAGKYVLIYFGWLHKYLLNRHLFRADLLEVYENLYPEGQFEIVFVALGNDKVIFDKLCSSNPWLAIPHEDKDARNQFIKKFAIPREDLERGVLFAHDGTVVLKDAAVPFRFYGPEGFPFTKERMDDEMRREDGALRERVLTKKFSLTELLGKYLISRDGEKVLTSDSELKYKFVGLHYVHTGYIEQTKKLFDMWSSLKNSQHNMFEIVLVNDPAEFSFSKTELEAVCGSIPWYSRTCNGRKLWRVFQMNCYRRDNRTNAGFFIIERNKSLSYFAFDILRSFGIKAFPFNLESAVKIEMGKQREAMVLAELLSPSAPLRCGGSSSYGGSFGYMEDTIVAELSGHRVLLLFATHSCIGSGSFLPALKKVYCEKMWTNDQFEIIYISLDLHESTIPRCMKGMPWWFYAFVPDFAAFLAKKVFNFPRLPAIAAFGPDGHLQAKESNLLFKKEWNSEFPFIKADMSEEVQRELILRHKWDLKQVFPNISTN